MSLPRAPQRRRCPVCAGAELEPFFAMRRVPVFCNVLLDSADAARAAPRGDIELGFCGACGMIYNVAFDPTLLAYAADYENSLHGSPRFQDYARELAARLLARYRLEGARILEIGCGKGDFLALLAANGRNHCVGFDASYDGRQVNADVHIVKSAWDPALGREHAADLLVCRHVLEHVADPAPFLAGMRGALRPGGALYLEVPDVTYTLRDHGIWDVIYEHCSYFTVPAIVRLLESQGLRPSEVHSSFGNQFLCVEAVPHRPPTEAEWQIFDAVFRVQPQPALVTIARWVHAFAAEFAAKVAQWSAFVNEALNAGRRLAVWGAGSKGVTFLNTIARGDEIHAVVDINDRKVGRCVPGTGQCIRTPEQLAGEGADIVLVMNPNYRDEIMERLRSSGLTPELLAV